MAKANGKWRTMQKKGGAKEKRELKHVQSQYSRTKYAIRFYQNGIEFEKETKKG